MVIALLVFLGAYLVGAIPLGYLIARTAGVTDIRTQGSGNIGATNVARVLGAKYFFIVFLLDAAKAFFYLKLLSIPALSQGYVLWAAVFLLLGNSYSIFLRFSGGKGVATAVGIIAALAPHLLVGVVVPWGILLLATRTMGVANVGAALSLPFFSLLMQDESLIFYGTIVVAGWIFVRHLANIRDYLHSSPSV